MTRTNIDGGWIRCGKCGHKLGKIVGSGAGNPALALEIKCHSCKEINLIGQDTDEKPSRMPAKPFKDSEWLV